jgi:hypothetical protein
VILTSDESAGITRGDDLTRSLSQNWIPLVVFGPGVPVGTVPDLFSQPDLPLSVLDYLGLADRGPHLMGRSIFRRYDRPRPHYFANTYLRSAERLAPRLAEGDFRRLVEALPDVERHGTGSGTAPAARPERHEVSTRRAGTMAIRRGRRHG